MTMDANQIKYSGKYAKDAYKKEVFEIYKKWKRMPGFLKGLSPIYLERVYRVTNFRIVNLLQITTQKDFARCYGVRDLGTLTDWNERIEREAYRDLSPETKSFLHTCYKNLLGALYIRLLVDAKPKDVYLWMRLVEDWNGPEQEKKEVEGKLTKRKKNYLNKLLASGVRSMHSLRLK